MGVGLSGLLNLYLWETQIWAHPIHRFLYRCLATSQNGFLVACIYAWCTASTICLISSCITGILFNSTPFASPESLKRTKSGWPCIFKVTQGSSSSSTSIVMRLSFTSSERAKALWNRSLFIFVSKAVLLSLFGYLSWKEGRINSTCRNILCSAHPLPHGSMSLFAFINAFGEPIRSQWWYNPMIMTDSMSFVVTSNSGRRSSTTISAFIILSEETLFITNSRRIALIVASFIASLYPKAWIHAIISSIVWTFLRPTEQVT